MPEMIDIYHGSVNIVEKPIFGAGKIHNDYGETEIYVIDIIRNNWKDVYNLYNYK